MSNLADQLGATLSLGAVAEAEDMNSPKIVRILDTIARIGLAKPVAKYLLEKEQAFANERARRSDDALEAHRRRWNAGR